MKKLFALLLAALLLTSVALPALADTFVQTSRLSGLLKNIAPSEVLELELNSGKITLVVTYEGDTEKAYACFAVEGTNSHIISFMLVCPSDTITSDTLSDALLLCNTWNEEKRIPRLYVDMSNMCFAADTYMYCTANVNDDMLSRYMEANMNVLPQLFTFLQEAGYSAFKGM